MGRLLRKLGLTFGRQRFRDDLEEEKAFHRAEAEKEGPQAARYRGIAVRADDRGYWARS